MIDKHQALRDALDALSFMMHARARVEPVTTLLADHDRMQFALERICAMMKGSPPAWSAVDIADETLKECELKSAIIEAAEYIESELNILSMRPSAKRRKLVKLAQRLRAEASGWQPIDTAPKDGRFVDLWFLDDGADGRSTDCYFKDGHWRWEGQRIVYLPSGRPAIPTHWMPIPKPPPSWDASLFEKSSVIRAPQRGGR